MGFLSKLAGKLLRSEGAPPPRLAKGRFSVISHVAFDGAVRVLEAPLGEGWAYDEAEREGDGFTVMVLKYLLPAEPTPLALLAKIYTVEPGYTPPEDPERTDWRMAFGPLFAVIENVAVHPTRQTTMAGTSLPACEAIVDGPSGDAGAPLRIRERRAVLAEQQFIVTAMGPPELLAAHAVDVEKWFATAVFVPRSEATRPGR
jgi:hypothetical protein